MRAKVSKKLRRLYAEGRIPEKAIERARYVQVSGDRPTPEGRAVVRGAAMDGYTAVSMVIRSPIKAAASTGQSSEHGPKEG